MTTKTEIRNKEIIRKSKDGKSHIELAKEYNLSRSNINAIVEQYIEFNNYCNNMENLISQNLISEETKMYELAKMLKFDARSINGLKRKGIKSIEELIVLTDEEIWALRKIGKISREHIKKCISSYMKNNFEPKICEQEAPAIKNSQVETTIDEQPKIQNIKANRDYIWKLIDLVEKKQFSSSFLKKELDKEFDRLEKANKQLIEIVNY